MRVLVAVRLARWHPGGMPVRVVGVVAVAVRVAEARVPV